MQLNLPLQKKAIFLSSMNGIYTEVIFYIHQKGFCKFRVSIFIEIFSSSFLLMLSYSASVSPYYNYSSLITSTSQFSIYLPRRVGLGFRFFLCLNFWKQPSLSASKKCFSEIFWKLPIKQLWHSLF